MKGHRETLVVLSIAVSGSVIVLQTWVMASWSCLACVKFSAGTWSTKMSLPCFMVSVLSVLGVLGSKLETAQNNEKKRLALLRPWLGQGFR